MRDCWRRCVARMLAADPDSVPDFVGEDPLYWLAKTAAWLADRGYTLMGLVPIAPGPSIDVSQLVQPRPPYMAVGLRRDGGAHAVVVDADGKTWDPLDGGGLLDVLALYWMVPDG